MHVTCKRCNTTYTLDSDLVKDSGTKVRCSKCKHVFIIYNKEHPLVKSNTRGSPATDTDILSNESNFEQVADDDLGYLQEKESRIRNRRIEYDSLFDAENCPQNSTIVESHKSNDRSDNTADKLKENEAFIASFEENNKAIYDEEVKSTTSLKNDGKKFSDVDIEIERRGSSDISDDLDLEDNFENNIEDSDSDLSDKYLDIPCVPTLDEDFDSSFSSQGQDDEDWCGVQGWEVFDFEPDEFDDNIQVATSDEVNTDIDVSAEDRAYQMAMQVAENYGWINEQIELLADVFRNYGWSFTRNSILNELKSGMKFYEFEFAVELRKIWQSHPEYSIGYVTYGSFGDNSLKYKPVYINPDWAFCLKIVRRFDSIPAPEELEQHLDSLFNIWKNNPTIQDRHSTYYDFIRDVVDAGDNFIEMQAWPFLH